MGCLLIFADVVLFFLPMVLAWRMELDVFSAGVWGTGIFATLRVISLSFYWSALGQLPLRTKLFVIDFQREKRQRNSFWGLLFAWVARAYVVIYVLQMLR